MTVAACLSWFDEPVESLERCASSLRGVADFLVALDGAWALQPHEACSSPDEQALAIIRASRGVETFVQYAPALWPSQVAKRAELMRLGAETGADWLLVIDGDEYIESSLDLDMGLLLCDQEERDVAQVLAHKVGSPGARAVHRLIRRLYRASTGVTVRTAHNGYVTRDGRWLHGDPAYVTLEEPTDLSGFVTIAHDLKARGSSRRQQQLAYRTARRTQRTEVW